MNFKSSKTRWMIALTFALFVTLAITVTIMSIHGARAAASPSGATIASDQVDYSPGSTVSLTGAGWDSGEAVHIFVNDAVGNTWSLNSNPDPVADDNGGFTYSFSLPSSFISSYTVTATGATSGTATTTFTDSNCPASATGNPPTDNDVGASFTTSGSTATYTFSSFVNKSPSAGVPGLIEYCVYTTPPPNKVTPVVNGADGTAWSESIGSDRFAFERPGGNPSNIQLDGTTGITMGSATWPSNSGGPSTNQTILLHINDPAFCQAFDGQDSCFVLPGKPQQQAKDLTVSTTTTPSFTRTFKWGITKDVDKTKITDSSGSATFNYTVSVTHDKGTNSNWQVTGTITVNNPNGSDVTGVNVADAVDNGGNCTVTNGTGVTVPKSSSVKLDYTCTYSSAPSPNSGTNTAKATWTAFGSLSTSAQGTDPFDFGSVSPKLNDDSVSVSDSLGGTLGTVSSTDASPTPFTYSHTVTGKPGTCVSQDNTATFTTNTTKTTSSDSKTVMLCTPVDLQVKKDATPSFTRTYAWGINKSVDQPKQTIAAGGRGTFNYTVEVTHDSGTDSNWTVSGTITVSNPNDFEDVTLSGVTDSIDNGGTCKITKGSPTATVSKSGSVTLDYTCTYASAPSPLAGTNTATATWDQSTASTPSGNASGTANVDFSTTTPTVVDGKITVVDDKTDPANPVTLGTADYTQANPIDFKYALDLPGKEGTCTNYTNTATFTTDTSGATGSASQLVTLCVAVDLQVKKDATPSFTRTFTWGITKSVDQTKVIDNSGSHTFTYTVSVTHDSGTDSDWQVNGTITVSNPNDFEDIVVANVSDTIDNGGNCTVTGGTNVTVPAGKSVTLSYTCTYASAPSPGSGTNTATASWDQTTALTPGGSASGAATFDFAKVSPKLVDDSVSVSDSLGGPLGTVKSSDPSPTTFTYLFTVKGTGGTCVSQDNKATFTTNTTSATGSDSKTVTLCTPVDLQVKKDATPSFTRTYNWSISKSVTPKLVEQIGGGTATVNYTVNVNETGFTDSAWTVSGTITVTNPNDWEAITATTVTDVIDNNGSCTVTGGTGVSVPASGHVDLPYTCMFSSNPGSGTNTATANWDSAAAFTPTGSAPGTATYAFGTPTTVVNQDIAVTDTFNGTITPLGTLTATDGQPFASATYKYPRTVNVPAFNCVTYPNTATIIETGQQTASASIEVCGPAQTGALTMGFWQNKNGQGIINGANQANLGTWLNQFHPFSNAPSSNLAAYVSGIIKAATCSGPATSPCNAMLRAQMLATALDVYFSGGPGGNKINAPAAIGGVTIDLTKICQMSDGSGGTATCSGAYENVSSAFGGATSMTVMNMLLYQNTSDPAADAGAVWYGNVKANQVLAKDAFDAINNQVAFAP